MDIYVQSITTFDIYNTEYNCYINYDSITCLNLISKQREVNYHSSYEKGEHYLPFEKKEWMSF